jgi:hypothetical protein
VKIECTYDRLVAPGDLTPAKSNPRKHGKEQLECATGWNSTPRTAT